MAFIGQQFMHLQELLDYLNGIVLSRDLQPTLDLNGLTLILDASTVTFVGNGLTPNQVVAQINAVVAGAATLRNYGQASPPRSMLALIKAAMVVQTSGTANALLGLPTSGAAPTVGANAVAKVDVLSVTEFANRYSVIHE